MRPSLDGRKKKKLSGGARSGNYRVVYSLGGILGSVGHRVKVHNITPATGKEWGDLEIEDYVDLQKPQTQANRLPP